MSTGWDRHAGMRYSPVSVRTVYAAERGHAMPPPGSSLTCDMLANAVAQGRHPALRREVLGAIQQIIEDPAVFDLFRVDRFLWRQLMAFTDSAGPSALYQSRRLGASNGSDIALVIRPNIRSLTFEVVVVVHNTPLELGSARVAATRKTLSQARELVEEVNIKILPRRPALALDDAVYQHLRQAS